MATVKIALPTYLASFLLNNDEEGVTEQDRTTLAAILMYEFGADKHYWSCVDVDDDSVHYGQFAGKGCELADYTFIVRR